MEDRPLPVGDLNEVAALGAAPGGHRISGLGHDRSEVFRARVFGGDDGVVGELGGDIPHQAALLAIPQTGTAKDSNDTLSLCDRDPAQS